MADIVLGEVGSRVRLEMADGAAFGPYRMGITVRDAVTQVDVPIDLTGAVLTAEAWSSGDPYTVLERFSAVVAEPELGSFDLSATEAQVGRLAARNRGLVRDLTTSILAPLAALQPSRDPVRLEWALYVERSGQTSQRVFYGPLLIFVGATP